jgi:hypothetical protein
LPTLRRYWLKNADDAGCTVGDDNHAHDLGRNELWGYVYDPTVQNLAEIDETFWLTVSLLTASSDASARLSFSAP